MKNRLSSRESHKTSRLTGWRWIALMRFAWLFPAFAGMAMASGTGTVDLSSGWYPSGTNLTVTAMPTNIYSRFDRWEGDTNGAVIAADTLTVSSLSGPKSITAVFVESATASNAVPYSWLHMLSNTWTTVENFEAAVTNDHDGDGFTTAQEYWSGTDPFSSASFLHISGVQLVGGSVRLLWQHSRVDSNNVPPLCVQICTDLNNPDWQDAAANTNVPVEGLNAWEEPYLGARFYRLIVPAMP